MFFRVKGTAGRQYFQIAESFREGTRVLFEEIAPTLEGCVENPAGFAKDVLDRFRNPAIEHKLSSIALNHADKVKVRLVPTAHQFEAAFGKKPPILSQLIEPYLNEANFE